MSYPAREVNRWLADLIDNDRIFGESPDLSTMNQHEGTGLACAPGERGTALPDLDGDIIGNWKSFLPPDKFEELVASQLEGAKSLVQCLLEAGQSGKLEEIKRAAHDVKGVCGNLGMTKICDLAGRLEKACQSGQEQEALGLLQAINTAMPAAVAAYEDLSSKARRQTPRDGAEHSERPDR